MLVNLAGQESLPSFDKSSLVIACSAAGHAPFMALDLIILNDPTMKKVAYYKKNDSLSLKEIKEEGEKPKRGGDQNEPAFDSSIGVLTMPAEVYHSEERKLTLLYIRASISEGCMRRYGDELISFVKREGFVNVSIFTASISPIRRDRESNRQIPEVMAYLNNYLYKKSKVHNYYKHYGIRKFGYWLADTKATSNYLQEEGQESDSLYSTANPKHKKYSSSTRRYVHRELDELMAAGMAKGLLKAFNRVDLPCLLYVIFTCGEYDFVGGYTLYQFIQTKLNQSQEEKEENRLDEVEEEKQSQIDATTTRNLSDQLGKVCLHEQSGEEIHELLFQSEKLKIPYYWKQIATYY